MGIFNGFRKNKETKNEINITADSSENKLGANKNEENCDIDHNMTADNINYHMVEGDFAYVIQDMFEMKDGGVTVVGLIVQGEIKSNDQVIYSDLQGNVVGECTVARILQANNSLEMASDKGEGKLGAHYGFYIPEFQKEQIKRGDVLISPSMLLNDKLKQVRDLQIKMAEETNQAPYKISNARKNEIGPIVLEKEISKEKLTELSIQEVNFLICSMKVFHEKSPLENYEQNNKILYQELIEKLRAADTLYMTFDKTTGFPFINEGMVDIYSKVEFAKDACDYYTQQYRNLEVKEITRDKTNLPNNMGVFAYLYCLGMEKIMIDNGQYKVLVNRSEILPPPDFSKVPQVSVPIINPELRFAIINFFEELRWRVNYPQRVEVMKTKENKMIEEICKAKYLVPMKHTGEVEKSGDNQITFKEGGKMFFAKITNVEEVSFIPVFTDWTEFEKAYNKKEWNGAILSILDAIRIGNGDGIAINPYGENLILNEKNMAEVKAECERLNIKG